MGNALTTLTVLSLMRIWPIIEPEAIALQKKRTTRSSSELDQGCHAAHKTMLIVASVAHVPAGMSHFGNCCLIKLTRYGLGTCRFTRRLITARGQKNCR
jgi:hypothetical protein